MLQDAQLGHFLGLERIRVVEDLAVPVAEDVSREPAGHPKHAGLEHRSQDRLDHRLTCLVVLPANGHATLRGEGGQRRRVDGQVWCPVGEGDAFHDGRVGIKHGRRYFRVVFVHPLLKRLERLVHSTGSDEHLGGGRPHQHDAVTPVGGLEIPNVLPKRFGKFPLGPAGLDVGPFQVLDVLGAEHRRHGSDRLERILDRIEMLPPIQYSAVQCRFIGVGRYRIPGPDDEVVERRERDELLDQGNTRFRPLAQPDGAHLRERSDRLGLPPTDQLYTGDERRGDGT